MSRCRVAGGGKDQAWDETKANYGPENQKMRQNDVAIPVESDHDVYGEGEENGSHVQRKLDNVGKDIICKFVENLMSGISQLMFSNVP